MKNSLFFKYLTTLALSILAQSHPVFSDSDFETHPQLEQGQAQVSQAFGNYFSALMSGSEEQKQNAEQALNQAGSGVSRILHEQHEKEIKTVFGKVYFMDGRVVDSAEYAKDPKKYDLPSTEAAAKAGTTHPSSSTAGSAKNQKSPGPGLSPSLSRKQNDISSSEPEVVLDGSNVPKELVFSGKKAVENSKSAKPDRKPGSTK